ncbi:hypothetical protein GW17_00060216 [Ensete ventricosum]|nr:hypothetical protein GW17_00060216 [Ensete ventricosum]
MADACRGGACGSRLRPRLGRRGWLPTMRLQGAASQPGLPPARVAAPTGAAPAAGMTTHPGGAVRVREEG